MGNRCFVPDSPLGSQKNNAPINVELCLSVKMMYIYTYYKYIYFNVANHSRDVFLQISCIYVRIHSINQSRVVPYLRNAVMVRKEFAKKEEERSRKMVAAA